MAGLSGVVRVGAALAAFMATAPALSGPMRSHAGLPAFCIAQVDYPAGENSDARVAGDQMFVYRDGQHLWLNPRPILTGADVARVGVGYDPVSQGPTLRIRFRPRGRHVLATYTAAHINRRVALVLDGKVLSAPIIFDEIRSGEVEPSGDFGDDAQQVAARIQQIADSQRSGDP